MLRNGSACVIRFICKEANDSLCWNWRILLLFAFGELTPGLMALVSFDFLFTTRLKSYKRPRGRPISMVQTLIGRRCGFGAPFLAMAPDRTDARDRTSNAAMMGLFDYLLPISLALCVIFIPVRLCEPADESGRVRLVEFTCGFTFRAANRPVRQAAVGLDAAPLLSWLVCPCVVSITFQGKGRQNDKSESQKEENSEAHQRFC